MLVGYVIKLLAIVALYLYMYSENKRRDRDAASAALSISQTGREETTEKLTDPQNVSAIDGKIGVDAIERGMLVCAFSI